MKSKVINLVIFQLAWFACILGAGNGLPWLGIVVVGLSAIGHLVYVRFDRSWMVLLPAAFGLGWLFDWIVLRSGAMGYPDHARLLTAVPVWMPFMWVNFATTLYLSMSWMKRRYFIAAVFGFLGGPGAYYTGMKLGAVLLGEDLVRSLMIIGVEWVIATPLLLVIAEVLSNRFSTHDRHAEPVQGAHV